MIVCTTKVWGPGVSPGAFTLVAIPGDKMTPEQAEEFGVDPETGAQIDSPVPEPSATVEPDEDNSDAGSEPAPAFPTAEEIAAMKGPALAEVDKVFNLGVGKMNVDDKRIAVAGAIEELALELKGLEGLDAEEILALEDAANDGS